MMMFRALTPPSDEAPLRIRPFGGRLDEAPPLAALEFSLLRWLQGHEREEVLRLDDDAGAAGPVEVPLEHVLRRLITSTTPLPQYERGTLGITAPVTIGTAAGLLLDACTDPRGPRCRSYRSASYYLAGLALLGDEEERAHDGLGTAPLPADATDVAGRRHRIGRASARDHAAGAGA
jgi:hypothetical protein